MAQGTPLDRRWSLPGDVAWWFFLTAEFVTLCLFFVVFAFMRRAELPQFVADQQGLDPRFALVNSLVLITSGYCVARGVARLGDRPHGHPADGDAATSREPGAWFVAATILGVAFVLIKGYEYADKLGYGVGLDTSTFWFFYYFLTGFHFLHVLLGIGFLGWVAVGLLRDPHRPGLEVLAESSGAFWHMLDLVWIILFPLVYLL